MSRLRCLQVGMGGWGRSWAALLQQHPDLIDVAGYVDAQPAMLELTQAALGTATPMFTRVDEALRTTDAEAVLITTALGGHVPVARQALEAGKHVLIEKPFAPSLQEAHEIVELAAAHGRIAMVSQNYRFYPAAQVAAALVRERTLGPVNTVQVQFRRLANAAPRGTNPHYHIVQPLLIDMAIHHFDLMRFVLGQEPISINCHAWNPPWSQFDDPAVAMATICFDGGAVVQYHGNWVSAAPQTFWAGEWLIECADGTIAWTGRNDTTTASDMVRVTAYGKKPRRIEMPILPYWDRVGAFAAFAESIRHREPVSSARDNIGSLALMLAAVASAQTGQTVQL